MSGTGKTIILRHEDILLKIERMAWEVLELNPTASKIVLVGIQNKGLKVASLVRQALNHITDIQIDQASISINKSNPKYGDVTLTGEDKISGNHVVLVDDVLNSGRTLMYSTLPILEQSPASLNTLILANRDHASFPIKANIVGVSLATTLQEHITFDVDQDGQMFVYLT